MSNQGEIRFEADLTIEAAEGSKLPTITMSAYNGGVMQPRGISVPVVVDIEGISWPDAGVPILKDHNQSQVVGHSDEIIKASGTLQVLGTLSGTGEAAKEVLANAGNGFRWQASIGAPVIRRRMIGRGEKLKANGREFTGPLLYVEQARLREVSVVAAGGDETATTLIAASFNGGSAMKRSTDEFSQWASGEGFDIEAMSEGAVAKLRTMYDREHGGDDVDRAISDIRDRTAGETRRQGFIKAAADRYGVPADRVATAIESGMDARDFELEALRSSYAQPAEPAKGVRRQDNRPSAAILEAAACLSLGLPDDMLTREYGAETLERAGKFRGVGLKDVARIAASIDGHDTPDVFGDGSDIIQAATSTSTFASVASNVIGKQALAAYQASDIWALRVARTRSVRDFKQVENYRLTGGVLRKLARGGQLDAGVLADQQYTNQADTYGLMYEIDRRDIINDDLGLLSDIGNEVGRAGANSINVQTATVINGNAGTFWGTGNGNYISGADTVIGTSGLDEAWETFRKLKAGPTSKKGDNKHRISVMPRLLLVPPELEMRATRWTTSANLNNGATTDNPEANVYAGRLTAIGAPELSDTAISGASSTAWYMLADPGAVASIELAFLNGRQTPTLERRPRSAGFLGIAMEAVLDFGVALQDPVGSVKSKGAA
jgi:hypothetical protein